MAMPFARALDATMYDTVRLQSGRLMARQLGGGFSLDPFPRIWHYVYIV